MKKFKMTEDREHSFCAFFDFAFFMYHPDYKRGSDLKSPKDTCVNTVRECVNKKQSSDLREMLKESMNEHENMEPATREMFVDFTCFAHDKWMRRFS